MPAKEWTSDMPASERANRSAGRALMPGFPRHRVPPASLRVGWVWACFAQGRGARRAEGEFWRGAWPSFPPRVPSK